jgi:DNA-binding response OmpR family regulator
VSTPQNSPDSILDLDARRAAAREVREAPTLTLGGAQIELPHELPVDVLEPLLDVKADVSVLIRQVLDARDNEDSKQTGLAVMGAVIDMLIVNPSLPRELIAAVKEMVRRLIGDEGYEALLKFRPTAPEIKELAGWAIRQYGVGLGEALQSSDSSEGTGTTSKPTSSRGTAKTSGRSTSRQARRAS